MTGRGTVVVVGSANVDLVLAVERIPEPGETLLAGGLTRLPGGKGANQAVAAARAGAVCTLISALGSDDAAELLSGELEAAGVDTGGLRTVPGESGLALVLVDAAGENAIVVAAGANGTLDDLDAAERELVAAADVLLAQLEVPVEGVLAAASAARAAGTRVVLNAAPARPLPAGLWPLLDVLVVNEHEARRLAELPHADPAAAGAALLDRVPFVVVTLGAGGAIWLDRVGTREQVPAVPVRAVDTTGAGDTFCGVLAAELAAGGLPVPSLQRANAAASLCVEAPGAIPSIPDAEATDRRWRDAYPVAGQPGR